MHTIKPKAVAQMEPNSNYEVALSLVTDPQASKVLDLKVALFY